MTADETPGAAPRPPYPPPAAQHSAAPPSGLLLGTPAFEALFAMLEHAGAMGDPAMLGTLLGSNLTPFG